MQHDARQQSVQCGLGSLAAVLAGTARAVAVGVAGGKGVTGGTGQGCCILGAGTGCRVAARWRGSQHWSPGTTKRFSAQLVAVRILSCFYMVFFSLLFFFLCFANEALSVSPEYLQGRQRLTVATLAAAVAVLMFAFLFGIFALE